MNNQFNFDMYQMVAKNIKKFREAKKLSLTDLAKYAEISESFLERFENLEENLTISIYDLYKISVILDVSINYFFE